MAAVGFDVANGQWRTFTLLDADMAYAMLRGGKPIEKRSQNWWPLTWFFVHIGKQKTANQEWTACLGSRNPDFAGLQSCICGMVRFGRVIHESVLKQQSEVTPWVHVSNGPWCYVIEESVEFAEPVQGVKGKQGPWRIVDAALQQRLQTASVVHRVFSDVFLGVRSTPRTSSRQRFVVPWRCRADVMGWRGRPAARPEVPVPQCLLKGSAEPGQSVRKRRRTSQASEIPLPARTAATLQVAIPDRNSLLTLPQRLATGRTLPRLRQLMQLNFFSKPVHFDASAPARPASGLFAKLGNQTVFLLTTFTRRGVALADVMPLRESAPGKHIA